MKKHLVFSLAILLGFAPLFSQTNTFPANGSVGIGTITPNSSALLDISSTGLPYKGILIPRLTQAQRNAIVTPATGLLIYQTNATPGFYYYTGSVWTPVTPAVGANRNLSNLLATSINQHLLPAATNSRDLGSSTRRWKDVHLHNLRFADATIQNTAAKIYTGGTGVSIAGTVITNTAPDQTVILSGTGATTITGTYPNFNISSTDNNTTYTAGAGLLLTGTEFSNTLPDQTVTLTQGGATTITGTYPNFTISSTDNNTTYTAGAGLLLSGAEFSNTSPDQTVTLTGAGGTSISGTYPDFTITSATGSSDWSLNGNAVNTDESNFIGSTNDVALIFKVNNQKAGRIETTNANTFFGYQSGNSNATGIWNTSNGYQSLFTNTSGNYNTASGYQSLYSNTEGISNSAYGWNSLYSNTTGYENTANGIQSLYSNTTGAHNSAFGTSTLVNNTEGFENTAMGFAAMVANTTGVYNTANGSSSLGSNTIGYSNSAFGFVSLFSNTVGIGNSGLGYYSLFTNTTGDYNTALGYGADVLSGDLVNATAIGYNAKVSTSNSLILGGTGAEAVNVGIGTTAPTARLEVNGAVKITDGSQGAGKILTSDDDGLASWSTNNNWSLTGNNNIVDGTNFIGTTTDIPLTFKVNNQLAGRIDNYYSNTFFGYQSGNSNTTGSYNTANGTSSFASNTIGSQNTATGVGSLNANILGNQNTAVGNQSLYSNISGSNNTSSGFDALYASTDGYNNTANGAYALNSNLSGYQNTADGMNALSLNTTGNNNSAIGYGTLVTNSTGNNNTALGYGADVMSDGLTNATAIGYNAKVSASYSLVLGGTGVDAVNVGIGTTSPTALLDVAGNVKITDGTQGDGKVLTSDADGLASWQDASNEAWSLTGNTGISDGINFIGTINDAPLNFRVNNENAGRIDKFLHNTFYGYLSGNSIVGGNGNTAIGGNALRLNNSGNDNNAIGDNALSNNLSGHANVANGAYSLYFNETGNNNTATGHSSLYSNTSGSNNTAYGMNALNSDLVGSFNTAIGTGSSFYNVAGSNATAIGYNAMVYAYNTTTPFTSANVAIGFEALRGSTNPSDNSGNYNTAIGYQTLWNNSTGSFNSANGLNALQNNTSGSFNTANGFRTLLSNMTGNNNTALGANADVSTGSLSNATVIGFTAIVDASDKVRIGNSSVTSNGGQVGWSTYSDLRIKDNVQENVPGMEFINQLRPVTYHYNVSKQNKLEGITDTIQWDSKYAIEKIQFTGFIAQEVDDAAQKINYDFSGVDKSGTLMALRYSEFVVPLVKSVQELDSINGNQDEHVNNLESMIENQQAEIDELKDQINLLTASINSTGLNDGVIQLGTHPDSYQDPELSEPMLGQNIPNPYNNTTLIPFRIPKDCKDAGIMITSMSEGKVITVIPISCTETHISFEAGQLASGTYTYSLIVNGRIISTKEMILTK